ncbi:DUF6183 family protein [Streptomyces sp. NPDC087512]|uniref:DUF6183 family protein n=1 Tax=Streptomyces sp. NPDC087512 TaxID=3155059 RepID=UPI0034180947
MTGTTTEEFSQAVAAAVVNRAEESNGHSEAAASDLAEPVEPDQLRPGLPLDEVSLRR